MPTAGGVFNEDSTAMEGGVVGGNNVDGATAATTATATAPRLIRDRPHRHEWAMPCTYGLGVALQLLLSVQQVRWQMASTTTATTATTNGVEVYCIGLFILVSDDYVVQLDVRIEM